MVWVDVESLEAVVADASLLLGQIFV